MTCDPGSRVYDPDPETVIPDPIYLVTTLSSCLFGAESSSGQRERKSVWQGFQSKVCELVSGKLSKCLYNIHSTPLITSSALNECLLVHNSQTNCSTDCHSSITGSEVWLHNKCHKIYLSGPLGIFCLYVILTISYLLAQAIETSSLPTDSSRPLFKQIEIFSILTVWLYISTVSTFLDIRTSY